MTYRSVLVHAEPGEAAIPRLECAAAVATRFDAMLMGVGAELMQSVGVSDPFGMLAMEWQGLLRQQLEDNLKAAEANFLKHAGALPVDWRALWQAPADALCQTSRGADLIVAGGAPLKDVDVYRSADTAEVAIRSGRPVLVAPPTPKTFHGDRILVAWKDTREARRAVTDALPFLKRAEAVVVMEICDKEHVESAEAHTSEVSAYLERHGVDASAKVEIADDDRAAAQLHIQAEAMGADLIVAGCYGHSRMQEWVFGGVTRTLLGHPERFVLLGH